MYLKSYNSFNLDIFQNLGRKVNVSQSCSDWTIITFFILTTAVRSSKHLNFMDTEVSTEVDSQPRRSLVSRMGKIRKHSIHSIPPWIVYAVISGT